MVFCNVGRPYDGFQMGLDFLAKVLLWVNCTVLCFFKKQKIIIIKFVCVCFLWWNGCCGVGFKWWEWCFSHGFLRFLCDYLMIVSGGYLVNSKVVY